jgi:hypothetical protein
VQTVEYPGEDPPSVTYKCPIDKAILEYLKFALGVTIREAHAMAQEILNAMADPIIADGEVFELGGWLAVPGPRDRVNLAEAWKETERQAKTCQMLLEGEVDRAVVVLRNSIEWLEFWSVRAPTAEFRELFTNSLRQLLSGLPPGWRS